MESLAIHMVGTNRLYFKEVEHVLDRKSLSTFPEHASASAVGTFDMAAGLGPRQAATLSPRLIFGLVLRAGWPRIEESFDSCGERVANRSIGIEHMLT